MQTMNQIGSSQAVFGMAEFGAVAAAGRAVASKRKATRETAGQRAGARPGHHSATAAELPVSSAVRRRKVAALRRAIAAGTYHVSAAELAEKLIGAMLK